MAEVLYWWQFCDRENNRDITDEMYAERDASHVRAWAGAHSDTCLMEVERTPRGRFRITTAGDVYSIPVSAYDKRFASPLAALEYMVHRAGDTLREAVCRCGTPGGECD
ncbi:hypothetical protein E1091_03460 [Micromonospora fluostatini]|uniref:Uncharacterized protein n=1 Tax=Micromonospora fluostatini TaxID=1629071 RepID=A0ABY2DLB9_9ACTN|nr:hypothetical protein E1091_03460 [Micromonospora fluostatini]